MSTQHFVRPALATLVHEPHFDEGWIYERKLDGQRCLAVRDDARTRLYSRSGHVVTETFPEVAEALDRQMERGFVLDGEVVAFDGARTSFARLQPRINVSSAARARRSGIAVYYYVFDVLRAGGTDVRQEPLSARKRMLRESVAFDDPIRYTPHRVHADQSYLASVCERGWEGLIAKRFDAPYATGRTDRWLKFKCEAGQELVIVGFTEPQGSRAGFGALLLGYYADSDLVYAGKVGTGFSEKVLRDLRSRLEGLQVEQSPCSRGNVPAAGVYWVRPQLVAQIAFTEWTGAGQLRHPRYLGLRTDKKARDVVRE